MNYYPRKSVAEIVEWLGKVPIIVVVGARQVGKTVLLELVADRLRTQGIEERQITYLDLEDLRSLDVCNRDLDYFKQELQRLAEDFVLYGGFPAVVNETERKFKIGLLQEIVQTYVRKASKITAELTMWVLLIGCCFCLPVESAA
jgi:predicted AAA+ superfamily ATPase